jgi:hypothetical protein
MSDERDATIGKPLEMNGRDANGRFTKGHKFGFKPGKSGHPGRTHASVVSQAVRGRLAKTVPGDLESRTWAELIVEILFSMAMKYDIHAIKEIIDRAEGRPRIAVDLDVQMTDWREAARARGLTEEEVIEETLRLIAQHGNDDAADSDSNRDP